MDAIIRMALACLQLDIPQAQLAPTSAFFRRGPAPATFTVPPSDEYLRELHAAKFGLAHMPPVKPAIAALIVLHDEALRPDARCPRPQCQAADDLLSKAYDAAAACMGCIGNSLSHLMLALSASLQEAMLETSVHSFGDVSASICFDV